MPEAAAIQPAWQVPVLAGLSEAIASIEGHFVEIGGNLDAALDRLERQTSTFEQLMTELDGPAAVAAISELSAAIVQITENIQGYGQTSDALGALATATRQLGCHIPLLRSHMRELTVLAMYTRLEGNRLGSQGAEFSTFTDQMGRSVEAADQNLREFDQEIDTLGKRLASALHDHEAFGESHLTILKGVAARLTDNLRTMEAHRTKVSTCSAQVADRSRHMQKQVGQAVMALQVGDSTRQRLEHVHALVELMGRVDDVEGTPDMSEGVQRDILGAGSRLATELMADAIAEFNPNLCDVVSVFRSLAADARTTVELGHIVSGRQAENANRGSLAAMQADMRDIRDVVAAMQAARTVSQETIQGVMRSAGLLAARMGLMQDLEGEMNHMEFNAALKCQRLGPLGASVRVITGELRGCGQRTAQAAAGAVVELQRLTEVTQSLVIEDRAGSLDQSDRLLAGALETLAGIEQQSDVALSLLQENGAEVIRLLDRSAAGIVVNQNVTLLVENAASALPVHEVGADMGHQPAAELLRRIASIYTMESERAVHARVVGGGPQAAAEPIVADDFLL